ncbi:hypothetical protein [Solibacillus sp. FSL H8-0538]|uniref:hypothetical protein n=1 Tax=Solibacillus sp. FSL H8-0538 TaxID=2921400 RepID=UPI0030F65045
MSFFKKLKKKIAKTIKENNLVKAHTTYREQSGNSLGKIFTNKGVCGEYFSFLALRSLPDDQRGLYNVYIPKADHRSPS